MYDDLKENNSINPLENKEDSFVEIIDEREKIKQESDKKKVYYEDTPIKEKKPIPNFMIREIFYMRLFSIILICITFYFSVSGAARWWLSLVGFLIGLFFIGLSFLKKDLMESELYVIFSGYVISCTKKRIPFNRKRETFFAVKVYDEINDKYLCFNYFGKHEVSVGDPVTLYINKDEKIFQTEEGPTIEKYIGVEFSEYNEELSTKNIDIKDYLK